MSTTRLTVAQAVVRFLEQQYVERDGVETPFFAGLLGHLRPRQRGRRRPGPARARGGAASGRRARPRPALPPGAQRAGDGARRRRLRPAPRPARGLRLHGVGRARRDQHGDRRRAGDHQPHPGPAAARRRLRHPGREPGAPGAGGPDAAATSASTTRFKPVSRFWDRVNRPEQLPPSLLAAMRVLTDPAETGAVTLSLPAGRAGRGVGLADDLFARAGLARRPAAGRRRRPGPRRRARSVRRERPLVVAGGGVDLLRRHRRAAALRRGDRHPGGGDAGRQGRRCRTTTRASVGAIGATGTTAADALAAEADVVIGVGTRYSDFTTASQTVFADPDVRFVNLNVASVRRPQAVGRGRVRATPARGLDQLTRRAGGLVRTGDAHRARDRAGPGVGRDRAARPTTAGTARCRRSPR